MDRRRHAAAAESLKAQARQLVDAVAVFRLGGEAALPARHAAPLRLQAAVPAAPRAPVRQPSPIASRPRQPLLQPAAAGGAASDADWTSF